MKQEYKIRVSGNSLALTVPDELGWKRGDRVRIYPVNKYTVLIINIDRLKESAARLACKVIEDES